MQIKISFQHMPHSSPLENHTTQRIEKIRELLKNQVDLSPFYIDIHLISHDQHPHHKVTIHLKTKSFHIDAEETGSDMYVLIDQAVDTVIKLLKKEKSKLLDKRKKIKNEKHAFLQQPDFTYNNDITHNPYDKK